MVNYRKLAEIERLRAEEYRRESEDYQREADRLLGTLTKVADLVGAEIARLDGGLAREINRVLEVKP